MDEDIRHGPLLVGVDGTPESRLALTWAVAEAQAQGLGIRVVRVHDGTDRPATVADLSPEPKLPAGGATLALARRNVDEAIGFVRDRIGAARVDGDLLIGRPAQLLLEAAQEAAMVVLGSHHRTKTGAALLGSVANAVSAHSPGPVVVVRGTDWQAGRRPVMVGIDGSPASEAALAFAFEQAANRGAPLAAAHSWRPLGDISPDHWSPAMMEAARQQHHEWMTDCVAAYRHKYPDVPVQLVVVEGSPAMELVRLSEKADLVVVGSRGRGGIAGLLLGSVSQGILHHAHCPVAVVRNGT